MPEEEIPRGVFIGKEQFYSNCNRRQGNHCEVEEKVQLELGKTENIDGKLKS